MKWSGILCVAVVCCVATACTSSPPVSPQEQRARTLLSSNRLTQETSAYLLLHADNPVHWQPWDESALSAARILDRPVFLSIGYFSCYWCHVMERESFAATDVAALLNAAFVPIKVDREERPDLDALYMSAVNLMHGSGGWPMTVILLPTGEPFFGATYLPHEQLLALLREVSAAWRKQRVDLEARGQQVMMTLAAGQGVLPAGPLPDRTVVDTARQRLLGALDPEWGGFGRNVKFPMTPTLRFLWESSRARGDTAGKRAVRMTLRHMVLGGVFDQVGGGFHRYATDRRWEIPHFEKMLYDNVQLLQLLTDVLPEAGEDAPLFRQAARATADFLLRELYDPRQYLFWSALDAVAGGVEGGGYRWQAGALRTSIPSALWPVASACWNVAGPANMDGDVVLHWRGEPTEIAAELGLSTTELLTKVDRVRQALRRARDAGPRPAADTKSIVAWNGLAVAALARASTVLGDARYRDAASAVAVAIRTAFDDRGRTMHMVAGGQVVPVPGLLSDVAGRAAGELALADAGIDPGGEARALVLVQEMRRRFADDTSGGLFETDDQMPGLPLRLRVGRDGATPSGNSLAAAVLARLVDKGHDELLPVLHWQLRSQARLLETDPAAHVGLVTVLDHWWRQGWPPDVARPPATPRTGRTEDVVRVRRLAAGATGLQIEIADGWHINAHRVAQSFLVPTSVTAANTNTLVVRYPAPESIPVAGGRAVVAAWRGTVTIPVHGSGASDVLWLTMQACSDDGTCLAPATIQVGAQDP